MRALASCALVAAALVSCKGHPSLFDQSAPSAGAGEAASAGQGSAVAKLDAPPRPATVTPKRADPQVHELGMEHVVPTAIVIELATPIVDRARVGSVSAKSVVKVTPEIAGTLSYTGVSELTFRPARPFSFGTDYTFAIEKLETRDGLLAPPAGSTWSHAFKTEDFRFLGWAPSGLDLPHHKVTTEITFSGAVLPNLARASMAFTIDGHAPAGIAVLPSRTPNIVIVQLSDPRLAVGAKLALAVKAGLPLAPRYPRARGDTRSTSCRPTRRSRSSQPRWSRARTASTWRSCATTRRRRTAIATRTTAPARASMTCRRAASSPTSRSAGSISARP